MATTMLSLGSFKFSVSTAAYNELTQNYKWRWQSLQRVGNTDSLQYTGKDSATISLSGLVSTTLGEVGIRQIDTLRALGDEEKPHLLVSGLGDVLGYWVITDLNASHTKFLKGGVARSQSFTIEIKYYGDSLQD